ncbi:MAG: hypothetical protein EPO36_14415 [Chloroflexota bacterium]|nr:MAG: hypothetical protein EPO36_14415 [Chloroflexota bacterium]
MVAPLVLSYYVVLRSVLRLKPWLRKCLARCRHCGIFFLADARNVGRKDLGCPFGCGQAHRKSQSTRRSVAYYQEPEGKVKKRAINARRRKTPRGPAWVSPAPGWMRPILEYVCAMVGLIEGRKVRLWEVVGMLERSVRQHRMVRTRRIDQSVAWLNEQPP